MGQILTEPSQIKACKHGKYVLNICSLTLTNYFHRIYIYIWEHQQTSFHIGYNET